MNLAHWLDRSARAHPDQPAVGAGNRVVLTYGALADRAARIAGGLRTSFGLAGGDRVGIVATNCAEYIEMLFGIWGAGCIAVPTNAKLHSAELGFLLADAGARVCMVSPDLEPTVADRPPASLERLISTRSPAYEALLRSDPMPPVELPPSRVAWLFYTSGTTGRPKGAMLTHGNLAAMSLSYLAEVDPTTLGDVLLHAAPMSHGSGLYLIPHVLRGAANVVPESGGFNVGEVAQAIGHWRRTSMFAAPTILRRLAAAGADIDPGGIRTLIAGGAPLYVADALAAIERFGPCLAQIYGQGESPMTITRLSKQDIADRDHPMWERRIGSVGSPFAVLEVRTVDDRGETAAPDTVGEVVCRGPTVMKGYWNADAATAEALKDGWLRTGDLGVFDAQGYLTLKDRSKDLIISGGSNIYPREVEDVLLAHPAVREAAVIGVADPDWGEVVVAFVVGDVEQSELDGLCLSRIARYKRPRRYVFVDDLPKNNYGKVLKTALRESALPAGG